MQQVNTPASYSMAKALLDKPLKSLKPCEVLLRIELLLNHKPARIPVWLTKEDAQLKPLYEQLESEI